MTDLVQKIAKDACRILGYSMVDSIVHEKLREAIRQALADAGGAVAWIRTRPSNGERDFDEEGPSSRHANLFNYEPLYIHPAPGRVAELEAQLAYVTALHRNAARTLDGVLETRRSVERELAESREREAKLIADLDANLDAHSDERKRALSAESLARELHEMLADYVSQDGIAQGYGAGIGGTTYEKAEALLAALAADKEKK